jgi:glycosyltransferase involved in cell wall biosynthesis
VLRAEVIGWSTQIKAWKTYMTTPILFACQFSCGYGGVQHSMLDIIKHIDKTRFRPLVLCSPEGEVPVFAAEVGAEVHRVGQGLFWCYSLRRPLDTLRDVLTVARAIVRLAQTEGVRVIHTFDGMVFFAASLARLYQRDLQVIWLDAGFDLYKFYFRMVMRWCFKRAGCVATITRVRWRQLMAEGLAPDKSAVMPYGTDFHLRAGESTAPTEAKEAADQQPLRVGIVGRIVQIKNFELFLRAARLVADRHPQTEFVIVGGKGLFPDELAYYDGIIKLTEELGLTRQVVFHEPVPDLAPLLRTFDVLTCSSHLETFGRVFLEAMALRKPIVAPAVGGIPEVIADGETGFLVPPGDAAALADKISRLLADADLRAEMGHKGYERVLRYFDMDVVARRWERLYENLLSNRGAQTADWRPDGYPVSSTDQPHAIARSSGGSL